MIPFGVTRTARILIRISLAVSVVTGFALAALAFGDPANPTQVLVGASIGVAAAAAGFVAAARADYRGAWNDHGPALSSTPTRSGYPSSGSHEAASRRQREGNVRALVRVAVVILLVGLGSLAGALSAHPSNSSGLLAGAVIGIGVGASCVAVAIVLRRRDERGTRQDTRGSADRD